jgi:hypothetical protein
MCDRKHGPIIAFNFLLALAQGQQGSQVVYDCKRDGDPEHFGCPPRDSNPDMLIQSQVRPSENKENRKLQAQAPVDRIRAERIVETVIPALEPE